MSQTAEALAAEHTRPTDETLQRLGPGCYVKVGQNTGLFWAEVTKVEDGKFYGRVQQVYDEAEKYGIKSGQDIKFDKKLVCGTGCNKYCWC